MPRARETSVSPPSGPSCATPRCASQPCCPSRNASSRFPSNGSTGRSSATCPATKLPRSSTPPTGPPGAASATLSSSPCSTTPAPASPRSPVYTSPTCFSSGLKLTRLRARESAFADCRSCHHAVVPGRAAAALLERLSHRANGDTDIAELPNTSTGIDLLRVALSRATETLPFVDVAGNDDRLEQSAELFGAAALCDLRVHRGQRQRRPAPGCLDKATGEENAAAVDLPRGTIGTPMPPDTAFPRSPGHPRLGGLNPSPPRRRSFRPPSSSTPGRDAVLRPSTSRCHARARRDRPACRQSASP